MHQVQKHLGVLSLLLSIFVANISVSADCQFPITYTSLSWFQYYNTGKVAPNSTAFWIYGNYTSTAFKQAQVDNNANNMLNYACQSLYMDNSTSCVYYIVKLPYGPNLLQCRKAQITSSGTAILVTQISTTAIATVTAQDCSGLFNESCYNISSPCVSFWTPSTPLPAIISKPAPVFSPAMCPFSGTYQLSVTYNSSSCMGNASSTVSVTGSSMIVNSCIGNTTLFKSRPLLAETLTCLGSLNGSALNSDEAAAGISVLLLMSADNITLFCAKYSISNNMVRMSIDVSSVTIASCASLTYQTASSNFLALTMTPVTGTTAILNQTPAPTAASSTVLPATPTPPLGSSTTPPMGSSTTPPMGSSTTPPLVISSTPPFTPPTIPTTPIMSTTSTTTPPTSTPTTTPLTTTTSQTTITTAPTSTSTVSTTTVLSTASSTSTSASTSATPSTTSTIVSATTTVQTPTPTTSMQPTPLMSASTYTTSTGLGGSSTSSSSTVIGSTTSASGLSGSTTSASGLSGSTTPSYALTGSTRSGTAMTGLTTSGSALSGLTTSGSVLTGSTTSGSALSGSTTSSSSISSTKAATVIQTTTPSCANFSCPTPLQCSIISSNVPSCCSSGMVISTAVSTSANATCVMDPNSPTLIGIIVGLTVGFAAAALIVALSLLLCNSVMRAAPLVSSVPTQFVGSQSPLYNVTVQPSGLPSGTMGNNTGGYIKRIAPTYSGMTVPPSNPYQFPPSNSYQLVNSTIPLK